MSSVLIYPCMYRIMKALSVKLWSLLSLSLCLSLQGRNKSLVLVVFLVGFDNYKETSKQSNKRNEFSLVLHDRWGDHMRDYMDWRVTPPKLVTWPTLGLPPPCKQALSVINLNMRIRFSRLQTSFMFVS